MLQRLSICAPLLLVCASCGGAPKGSSDGDGGGEVIIKKVSLSWGVKPIGGSADIFLTVTDEIGRATSHPMGRLPGECAIIDSGRPSTGAITAVLCKTGDVGVELDAIPRPGMIIVLKMGYAAGAEPDPLAGEEVAHVEVPIGAKIETR